MDKELKDSHFQEYKEALKIYQEKRAVLYLDCIEELIHEFKNNSRSCSGGKSPGLEPWNISYNFINDEVATIKLTEQNSFSDRVHVNIIINRKSGWFTIYCPVYNDDMFEESLFKKPLVEIHQKYFPELKADYYF